MIDEWIKRIADGDLAAFERVYEKFKLPFIRVLRSTQGVGPSEAIDLYQDACTAFFNNVRTGRLTGWNAPDDKFTTYIIQVGLYLLFNKRRKRQLPLEYDEDAVLRFRQEDDEYDEKQDVLLSIVRNSVAQMQQPCSQLLHLVCFEKKSHQEVAEIMHYANAETVGTQRSRCMQKLRAFVAKQFKDQGFEDEYRRIQSRGDARKRHS